MKFIKQFKAIIDHPEVRKKTEFLLQKGAQDPVFIDYFGVNYNAGDLVSVKLYFSFFNGHANKELFDYFGINKQFIDVIDANWKPSDTFEYLHQGLTFSLKCYYEKGEVKVASYIHFRTPNFALGYPEEIRLTEEDLKNYPGICLESLNGNVELKKYFYITSDVNKKTLLEQFGLTEKIDPDLCHLIEYTESGSDRKINVEITTADHVNEILQASGNLQIQELSNYFFDTYKLYFRSPGYRYNSDTRAIYYMPRESYYKQIKVNTVKALFL